MWNEHRAIWAHLRVTQMPPSLCISQHPCEWAQMSWIQFISPCFPLTPWPHRCSLYPLTSIFSLPSQRSVHDRMGACFFDLFLVITSVAATHKGYIFKATAVCCRRPYWLCGRQTLWSHQFTVQWGRGLVGRNKSSAGFGSSSIPRPSQPRRSGSYSYTKHSLGPVYLH